MTNYEIFENVFDRYTQKSIIEFANKINLTTADYYIVMARKGKCFWDFLVDLELINVDGIVITERCLDMDFSYMKDCKVVIVDDIVISGTSIYSVVEKLNKIRIESLEICVLGVDECFNSTLFDFDIINNEGKMETHNYLVLPYMKLSNSSCVNLCSSIVKCFSYIPKAYDVDFPVFDKIKMSEKSFKNIISHYAWEVFDVTAEHQIDKGINILTLIPTQNTSIWLKEKIGIDILKYCFVKIRMFILTRQKNKKTFHLSIVPYVLFNEIYPKNIENLFERIIEKLSLFARERKADSKDYYKYFNSYKSKTRFVQYVLALKLVNIWREEIKGFCDKDIELTLKRESFTSIFTNVFFEDIQLLNNSKVIFDDIYLEEVDTKILDNLYNCDFSNSVIKGNDLWSIQARLTEPFIYLYKDKELKSRELVQKFGKEVYEKEEYRSVVGRLNLGYSYRYLTNIISDIEEFDIDRIVSLYIDKAIDAGIIVPMTAEKNGIIFRAYRHGEDIPFGDREFRACTLLLEEFSSGEKFGLMTRLRIEKMLMMMLKLNEHMNLFASFITKVPDESTITNNIVQSTHYLHGAILTYHEAQEYQNNHPKKFMTYRGQYKWLTDILCDKKILKQDKNNKKLYYVENLIDLELGNQLSSQISIMGQIFGFLCINATKKTEPQLKNSDLIILSSCLTANDVIPALAAEIGIFKSSWEISVEYIKDSVRKKRNLTNVIKELNNEYLCTSINSGSWKYMAFMNRKGARIIERIYNELESNKIYQQIWRGYWPDCYEWTKEEVNKEYLNLIYNQGRWLLYQKVLNRLLIITISKELIKEDNSTEGILGIEQKIKRCIQQTEETLNVLKEYEDILSLHIVKQSKETIKDIECNRVDYLTMSFDIIGMIDYLVKASISILDDSELLLNKYSEIHKIIRFQNVVFIEAIHEKNSVIDDVDLQNIINRVHKKNKECEVYLIPQNHNCFKTGAWLIASGKEAIKFLMDFVVEYRRSNKKKYKYYSFLELNDSAQIKKADISNTNYRYGLFWEKVSLMYNEASKKSTNSYEIIIVYNNAQKFCSTHKGIESILEEYNIECVNTRKVLFDDEIIKQDVCHIAYFEQKGGKTKMKKSSQKADIAIITIVPTETRAVLSILSNHHKEIIAGKTYHWGEISCQEKKYSVVICSQTTQGNISSALMYEQMKQFYPKYIFLFGIAGGISDKLTVDDVVIATDVIYYEKAKEVNENKYRHRGEVKSINSGILSAIMEFEVEYGEVPSFEYKSQDNEEKTFHVFHGPIGSGEIIFASEKSDLKAWMTNFNDKVLAVETEGYGVVYAYYENDVDKVAIPVVIIRGISDTADNNKGDNFRESSARNAAFVLVKFLQFLNW